MSFGDILVYVITAFGLYTAIFFTLTVFENRKSLIRKPIKWTPSVTIIVPCFNEEDTVSKTVESLLSLDYPKDKLEIFIVDDGSTDNTLQVVQKYKKQGVKIFSKKNGGKYTALNLGLSKCKTEIVGALDADSFVQPETLKRMIPYFKDAEVMAVTPSMKIFKPKNWLQRIQMIEYLFGVFLRKVFALLGSVHIAPGPFTIYRKKFFDEYGPYKKAYLTEDAEIALRIQSLHYQLENASNAYVYTLGPYTFNSLYKQRLRWYYGFVQNVFNDYTELFGKKHGNLGMFILPAAFFSVFLIVTMCFYMGAKLLKYTWDRYVFLKAIGFDWKQMMEFNIDFFFLDFSGVTMLLIITLLLSIMLITIAKRFASETDTIKFSYILNVLAYWVLFGMWWFTAFVYKVFRIPTRWGHKSSS